MKLIGDIFYFTVAAVLSRLVILLLVPVYTTYLSPDEYGLLSLVQVYVAVVSILVTLQLHSSITRYYYEYDGDEQILRRYLGTLFLSILALGALVTAAVELNGDALIRVIYSGSLSYRPYFSIGTWTVWVSILSSVPLAVLRAQRRARTFLAVSVAGAMLTAVLVVTFIVFLKQGLYGALVGVLLAELLTGVAYVMVTFRSYRWCFELALLKGPLKYSLPIIPHAIMGYIFMYSDRLILERYVSLGAIGLYALADRFAMAIKLLVNSFNNAFAPHFMMRAKADREGALAETAHIVTVTTYLVCGLALLLSLLAKEIIMIMADERYWDAWKLVPILTSAYVFRLLYIFASAGLFYEKKTQTIPVITAVAAGLNIAMNLWLVPRFGILAAAWSTFVSFLVTFLVAYGLSQRIFPLRWRYRDNLLILGAFFFLVAAGQQLTYRSTSLVTAVAVKALMAAIYLCLGFYIIDWRRGLEILRLPVGVRKGI